MLTVLLDNLTVSSFFVDCSPNTQVTIATAHGLISVSETVFAHVAIAIQ